jgi:hypothetical protein
MMVVLAIVAIIAWIAWTNGNLGTAHIIGLGASVLLLVLSGFGPETGSRPSPHRKSGRSVRCAILRIARSGRAPGGMDRFSVAVQHQSVQHRFTKQAK